MPDMSPGRLLFLRHAETEQDAEMPAALWGLSDVGAKQAENLKTNADLLSVEAVFVSEERKTLLTAQPLSTHLGLVPNPCAAFNEVQRGSAYLTKEDFEREKKLQLENLSYAAFNGETGNDALARFIKGVEQVRSSYPDKTVLIVTHGTVLNLYFAHVLNAFDALPDRWKRTGFCSYGIIEGNQVVKDIV